MPAPNLLPPPSLLKTELGGAQPCSQQHIPTVLCVCVSSSYTLSLVASLQFKCICNHPTHLTQMLIFPSPQLLHTFPLVSPHEADTALSQQVTASDQPTLPLSFNQCGRPGMTKLPKGGSTAPCCSPPGFQQEHPPAVQLCIRQAASQEQEASEMPGQHHWAELS